MQQNLNEIHKYLNALYRFRYLATIITLLVMTGIGIYSFSLPKKYQADTTVFIEKSVIDRLVRGIAVTPNISNKIRVLRYSLSSRDLIVKALEEIDAPIFAKTNAEQQDFISSLKERTIISVRGNDLFTVSLIGDDPNFIQKYINTLVGIYVKENISGNREEAYGVNRFLSEQIEAFKLKVDNAEDSINSFRKEKSLYYDVDEKSIFAEIKNSLERQETIALTLETLEAKKLQLQDQLDTLSPTVVSLFSVSGGGQSDSQLGGMQAQLRDLRLRYTDNYPGIVRLRFEIEALRKRPSTQSRPVVAPAGSKMTSMNPLYLDAQQRLLELQGEVSSLNAEKLNLQRMIIKREKELHEAPEGRKELNALIQERNSNHKIYKDLLARMAQSEVSKQMEIGNKSSTFRVVDSAVVPENPVSPNMLNMFLVAIAGGLGCAAGVVFLLVNIDSTVRDTEVFRELGIEVLAVVPNISVPHLARHTFKRDILFFGLTSIYGLGFVCVFAYDLFLR